LGSHVQSRRGAPPKPMEDGKLYTNADVQVENKRETLVSSEDEA